MNDGNELDAISWNSIETSLVGNGVSPCKRVAMSEWRASSSERYTATAASLAHPAGVAFDSAGNLYLADLNNHIIREVNIAGIAITVAGTGEQGFQEMAEQPLAPFSNAGKIATGQVSLVDTTNNSSLQSVYQRCRPEPIIW